MGFLGLSMPQDLLLLDLALSLHARGLKFWRDWGFQTPENFQWHVKKMQVI
jgi:hypothetical protein